MHYSGSLTREQFMFQEMRIVARLRQEGSTDAEILQSVYDNNLFQYPTEREAKSKCRACLKRLDAIADMPNVIEILAFGALNEAKQAAMIALMSQSLLMQDFMITVIGDKYRRLDMSLTRRDMNGFFERIAEQHAEVAGWSEQTTKKIKTVIRACLRELEYIHGTDDALYVWWCESIAITLDNEPAYTGSVADVPAAVLIDRLPHAKCFSIDFNMSGALPVYYDNPDENAAFCAIDESELWQGRGMADYLETLNGKEEFVYTGIFRYPDDDAHTEFVCIRDGQALNPEDLCTPDIVQHTAGCRFFGDRVTMYAAFDFKAHPQIVQQLREAVHDYVSDIEYTDTMLILWQENDECGDSGYLLSGCDIEDDDLSKSQQFADRVNQILAPIADQCTIYMNYSVWCDKVKPDPTVPSLYHCFHDMQHLAMASFVWADNKLQLVGKIL